MARGVCYIYKHKIDIPVVLETSRWSKMAMLKTCKLLGVNVAGFEKEILDGILKIEERRKLQGTRTKNRNRKQGTIGKGKNKADTELKNWHGAFKKAVEGE